MINRMFLFTLTSILLLMGITACKQKQEGAKALKKVRVVLDWTPNTNHSGIYVAQEQGYFKAAGLDVQIIQPGENTAEKIVAAGQAEFGISYQESVTIARSENIPIKSIAAIIQHNTSGFASLLEDNILSAKDFEGKTYGSSGWPSELEILRQVMRSADADFSRVKVISGVYDFFSTIGKDVDFEWIYYGWDGVQAKLKRIEINYLPIREMDPLFDFYTPVIIANDLLINSEPELVRAFLSAVSEGYEYCIAHPDKAAAMLTKAVPELDEELVLASLDYLKDEFRADAPQWGHQEHEVWQRFADWMYSRQIIKTPVKASDLYTSEFLP
ncbi:MAG: ABC transporter substrate-binding protein [Candidatus Syntrophosphaera sp.]|nr:ABC transporter substrate-binding protein [Candidatus Syntrophosphaera sp.]